MQDEINEKVIALSVRTTELTADILQKSLRSVLEQMKNQTSQPPKGKQSLKQLIGQNAGVTSIEITGENIKAFEHTAKKYGVDFAVKKDISQNPPRYLVFFKGRDSDVLTAAFKEFTAQKLNARKPSIRQTLTEIRDILTNSRQEVQRDKTKQREMTR